MIRTVVMGSHAYAQGPVVETWANGMVTINAGGKLITGWPVERKK